MMGISNRNQRTNSSISPLVNPRDGPVAKTRRVSGRLDSFAVARQLAQWYSTSLPLHGTGSWELR